MQQPYQTIHSSPSSTTFSLSPRPTQHYNGGSPPFASPVMNGYGNPNGPVMRHGTPPVPIPPVPPGVFNGLNPLANQYVTGHLGFPWYHQNGAVSKERGGHRKTSVLDASSKNIENWEIEWAKKARETLDMALKERSQKHNPFSPESNFLMGTLSGLYHKAMDSLDPEKEQRMILRQVAKLKQVEHPVWVTIDEFADDIEEFYETFYEEGFTQDAIEKAQDEGEKERLEMKRFQAFKTKMEDRNRDWLPQHFLKRCKKDLKTLLVKELADDKEEGAKLAHNIVGDRATHDCLLMAFMKPMGAARVALLELGKVLMTAEDFQPSTNPSYKSDLKVFKRIIEARHVRDALLKPDAGDEEPKIIPHYNWLFHKFGKETDEEAEQFADEWTAPWTFLRGVADENEMEGNTKGKEGRTIIEGDPGLYTGETVLHMCIMFDDEDMVKWVLDQNTTDTSWIESDQKDGPATKDLKCVQKRATGLYFKPEMKRKSHELARPDRSKAYFIIPDLFTDRDIDKIVDENSNAFFANRHDDKYLGELPLQWAATAGATGICKIIKEHVEKLVEGCYKSGSMAGSVEAIEKAYAKWGDIVNEADTLGNTPLHMAAMHGRKETFDWLLEHGAFDSFSKLNVSGMTPLTLCVWLSNVDMYQHVALKTSPLLWNFGSDDLLQQLRFTNLEMIDSYEIKERELEIHDDDRRRLERKHLEEKPWAKRDREEEKTRQESTSLTGTMSPDKAEDYWRTRNEEPLHQRPYWRSAFEIITRKEMTAFASEKIFQELVNSKWAKFGRSLYLWYIMVRYLAVLAVFMVACLFRTPVLRDRGSDLFDEEIPRGWDALNDTSGILFTFLAVFGSLVLGQMAFQLRRITRTDLDPDGNGTIDLEELLNFAFKNLASMSALVIIGQFIGIVANRALGQIHDEAELLAGTSIVLFCNLLNLLIPFKFVGMLVVTIYRMLVGDIARFLIVYLILLYGFGTASYVLQQERPIDINYENYPEERSPYAGTGPNAASLTFVWVTLGDNNFALEIPNTKSPDVLMIIHLLFVVFTNVLLLNLLISMMGDTYATNKEKTHQQWILPVASFILYSEKCLMSDHYKAQCRAGIQDGIRMQDSHKEKYEKKKKKAEKERAEKKGGERQGLIPPGGPTETKPNKIKVPDTKYNDPLAWLKWLCFNGDPPFLSKNSRHLMQENRAGERYTMTLPGMALVDDNEFTKGHFDKAFHDLKHEVREMLSEQQEKQPGLTPQGYPILHQQQRGYGF